MHFAHPVGDTKKLSFTVIQMLVIPESAVTRTALVSIAKERERERERERVRQIGLAQFALLHSSKGKQPHELWPIITLVTRRRGSLN